MQSAMPIGGRKLAAEWMNRLDVPGNTGERAHRAMAKTINLDLRSGCSPRRWPLMPAATPTCCSTSSRTPTAFARLAVHGIATEDDVHNVVADTRPQTVGTNRQAESAAPR